MKLAIRIFFFLFLLCALAAGYAFYVEPRWLKVSQIEIELPPGIAPSKPVRILLLSDLHPKGFPDQKQILRRAHEANPDIIMLAGDFIESKDEIDEVLDFVSRLPNVKTYSVLGNWEHWSKLNVREYRSELEKRSVRLLVNQCEPVRIHGQNFVVAGVDDPGTWYDDLSKTLKGCPAGYRILLSHSPGIMKDPKSLQFSLVLAGHCHGGQVRLPFYGPVWLPRGCSRDLYYGLFEFPKTRLYVTAGLGTSFLPIRFLSRPEIAVVTLKPAASAEK